MRVSVGLTGIVATALVIGSTAIPAVLGGQAKADTSPPSTLYVDKASSSCSDSGPGSQSVPFCTIQAAANVVSAGQTVMIESAQYGSQPVTITHSGTPSAPITFTGTPGTMATLAPEQPTGSAVITLKDVQDVTISTLDVIHQGGDDGIDVIGSSDITLSGLHISHGSTTLAGASAASAISIDGASSDVTVTRSEIGGVLGYGVLVHPGAQQVTVATNYIAQSGGPGIALDGAVNAVVTGNTMAVGCAQATTEPDAVAVTNGTSAAVENNILEVGETGCPEYGAGLAVDQSSAGTVTTGYNAFYVQAASTSSSEYSWAGTDYDSIAAFQAAIPGQGTNDVDLPEGVGFGPPPEGSPAIDSANCDAPGYTSTDYYGNARVADPLATDASLGNGTCHADRGAFERLDDMTLGIQVAPSSLELAAGTPATVTLTASNATSSWGEPVTYTADFGDGSAPETIALGGSTSPAATHVYTAPGTYTITVSAADTSGLSTTLQRTVRVYTATAPSLSLQASQLNEAAGVPVADDAVFTGSAGADGWEITSASISFGDGQGANLGTSLSTEHVYSQPGTYTATLTTTDALGRSSTATATVTVGDLILPFGPERAWAGTVQAHSLVELGNGALHVDWGFGRAALVTATVTSARKSGGLIIYTEGTRPRPDQAAVQFSAGQQASDVALATIMPGEVAAFYNDSDGPIGLVVNTIGEEVSDSAGITAEADTYVPVTPSPVLAATRVAGNHHVTFGVAGSHEVPANASAVLLDVTATGTAAPGHFVTYPQRAGSTFQAQGAYWAKGEAVTGLVVVPVDRGQAVLGNVSAGAADLSAQVVGYYEVEGNGSVFLPSPRVRILDVSVAGKHWVKLQVAGKDGVPATGTTAAMVNLTATGATANGSITAYADGTTRPSSLTSLSYAKGITTVNAAIVAVGKDGAIDLYNNGLRPVTVIIDLTGSYYSNS